LVESTVPASDGEFSLPGPFMFDVNFNEPIDPHSLQASSLVLSGIAGATVTAATVLPDNTTARFTINGISSEGMLGLTLAGVIRDILGNPNSVTFSETYPVDINTVAFPAPLAAQPPLGLLVYGGSAAGLVAPAGDSDSFTLALDAGQTLSVLATPATS